MVLAKSIQKIQRAKHGGNLQFSNHALQRMFERSMSVERIEQALNCPSVEIIENYPQIGQEDSKYLILGLDGQGTPIHVLVALPSVEVITTYEPEPPKWITAHQRGV